MCSFDDLLVLQLFVQAIAVRTNFCAETTIVPLQSMYVTITMTAETTVMSLDAVSCAKYVPLP